MSVIPLIGNSLGGKVQGVVACESPSRKIPALEGSVILQLGKYRFRPKPKHSSKLSGEGVRGGALVSESLRLCKEKTFT